MNNSIIKLAVYSLGHALIDLISALIVFTLILNLKNDPQQIVFWAVLYNSLAFGTQFIIGFIADRFLSMRFYATAGYILAVVALILLPYANLVSVVVIGLGNASYHIGGGMVSLNLKPGKAGPAGIYVAPGAIGLLIGTLLAKASLFPLAVLILLLVIFIILTFFLSPDKKPERQKLSELFFKTSKSHPLSLILIIIYLLLFVVVGRSFTGSIVSFPWKTDMGLLIFLVLGVAFGKALGGIFADKWGMVKIGTISLLISIPLIILGYQLPVLGVAGMLFFNMTMPITLSALARMLKGNLGLAFGLTCLALLIGVLPVILPLNIELNMLHVPGLILIPLSALFLFSALKAMRRINF